MVKIPACTGQEHLGAEVSLLCGNEEEEEQFGYLKQGWEI